MMEKKHQLVAWTRNITDPYKARLYMIPSLESEVQASLINDLTWIHKEEYKFHGPISLEMVSDICSSLQSTASWKMT